MITSNEEDIKALRAGGKILSGVLTDLVALAQDGVSTAELDLAAEHAIRARGAEPAFLNYQPEGAVYPFPATLCVSINHEVVHGIPNEKRVLRKGDVLKLDLGLSYKGLFVDSARTILVGGERDRKAEELIAATREALMAAIAVVRPGKHIGDIGAAVMRVAANRQLAIVEDLGGHGLGKVQHEKPFIANEGREGEGEELVEGMVLALEPMLAEKKGAIIVEEDEWTCSTKDGGRAAHFEDTILVTKDGAEVLTL